MYTYTVVDVHTHLLCVQAQRSYIVHVHVQCRYMYMCIELANQLKKYYTKPFVIVIVPSLSRYPCTSIHTFQPLNT